MTPGRRIADALADRLGKHVHLACDTVSDARGLIGAEKDAIARAVPKRQAEFAAGRRAARAALSRIGRGGVAIPAAADRAPVWPTGVVGSITHDQGLALAIIADTQQIHALGIDLTQAAPLPGETQRAILTIEESQRLDPLQARAAFAIKESLFKALHPKVQAFFGFDAAYVRPDLNGEMFTVDLLVDLPPYTKGATFEGALVCRENCIAAALVLKN